MNYTTYISAAEKLATFGQKNKSMAIIKHAIGMEERKIKELEFDILVGEVKPFNGAKFLSSRVIREKEGITIIFIFTSGDPLLPNSNTHRINVTINKDGSIKWHDGNLFLDRKSVKKFDNLVKHLFNYQKDMVKVLSDLSLSKDDLNVITRTFYI